jgi:histidinol-phosphate aminotransferase
VLGAPVAWGPRYRGWLRISVGTPFEHGRLERALADLYPRPSRRRPRRYRRPRSPKATASAPSAAGRATRRSVVAGAAAFAAAGLAVPRFLGDPALTRRRFLQGAAGATALAYGISRSPAAGAFPPDSFYDRFSLARMLYHENPLGPHPAALEAVHAVLARGPQAARRQIADDPPDLVDAILRYNRGVRASVAKLKRHHVLLTLGSAEALFLAADTFVAGGTLVVEWPSYRIVRERVLHQKGSVIDVPLRPDFRPDYEALKQALREHPETGMVRLEAQNNPCGTVLRRGEFDAFADHLFRHHPRTVLLIDESDPEYMEPAPAREVPDFPRYVAAGHNLVHIQTFSHVFALTGLRVGYAFAPPRLLARMRHKRIVRPVNVFGHAAALATLRESSAQVARAAPVVAEGRRYLYSELDRMGLRYLPSNGQYLFLDTGRSGTSTWASLIGLGVLTRYGREWGMESWLRVNPGVPEENQRFIAALRTVLSQPDPGNVPPLPISLEPLLPRSAEGRALARSLEARLARDTWIAGHAPPLRHPYRVVTVDALRG